MYMYLYLSTYTYNRDIIDGSYEYCALLIQILLYV